MSVDNPRQQNPIKLKADIEVPSTRVMQFEGEFEVRISRTKLKLVRL
jgi:hypothetical protein